MKLKKSDIAILVVYFGKWPDWTPYFLQSCSVNQSVHFIIISDSIPLGDKYTNIEYHKQTIPGLCLLIDSKLGVYTRLKDPYKLCDFKPSYGILFQDYLEGFKFWGYCDVDLIFGDLCQQSFLNLVNTHDIILGYRDFSSGPFALFRNKEEVNTLFMRVENYKQLLSLGVYQGFDEHIIKETNRGLSMKKLVKLVIFVFMNPSLLFKYQWLKYKFQWFYKERTIQDPVDFTEVLYLNRKKLRIAFLPLIINYADYKRSNKKEWFVKYEKGHLFDKDNREILVFHFGDLKYADVFKKSMIQHEKKEDFIVSGYGIKYYYG
jgi:hypothetical protein